MQTQNYKNHTRLVPVYHFFLYTAMLALLIGSIINLVHSSSENLYSASLIVLAAVIILFVAFFTRAFAVKAQDRAIAAEESLRYFILTGKPMDGRVTIPQKIALRFAPDEELVELTNRAVDENLSREEIKKAIKNWKADHYRV